MKRAKRQIKERSDIALCDIEDLITESTAKHDDNYHQFKLKEIIHFQENILSWYDINHRVLPWRLSPDTELAEPKRIKHSKTTATTDKGALMYSHIDRAYAVWISEIMCQQTQVATVIDYYHRWMEEFPTMEKLSNADLETVNQLWSGLGYYSRAKRIHDASKIIITEMDGKMPNNSKDLLKLPGVGKYTAGAIASIAFDEPCGVVDGNVQRVLARLRTIGADLRLNGTADLFWNIVEQVVPKKRPGDFNQALMELGATVCTPKNPKCGECPIKDICKARAEVISCERGNSKKSSAGKKKIIESDCIYCAQLSEPQSDASVYPFKSKSKPARVQQVAVCILTARTDSTIEDIEKAKPGRRRNIKREISSVEEARNQNKSQRLFLIKKRPKTGLLANLWEFPAVDIIIEEEVTQDHNKNASTKKEGKKNSKDKSNNAITTAAAPSGFCNYNKRKEIMDKYLNEEIKIVVKGSAAKTRSKAPATKSMASPRKGGQDVSVLQRKEISDVVHLFSHIRNTYSVEHLIIDTSFEIPTENSENWKWVTEEELEKEALSTAMRKVLKALTNPGKATSKKNSIVRGCANLMFFDKHFRRMADFNPKISKATPLFF